MPSPAKNTRAKLPDPETLYAHWLYGGLSLRKIGRIYGYSRTTVQAAIRSKYGKQATNPHCNSLARTIAQEYGKGYHSLVEKSYNTEGHYLTTRKEKNLTLCQSLDFKDDFRSTVTLDEPNEGLRLPLYIRLFQLTTEVLRYTLWAAELT